MKKVAEVLTLIILLTLTTVSCELFYDDTPQGTVRLITIALDYTDNETVVANDNTLSGTTNDAISMQDTFTKLGLKTNTDVEIISMIQDVNGNIGTYPSKENILDTLNHLNSGKYDRTIVYFSGHGIGIADSGNENDSRSILSPRGITINDSDELNDSFYFVTGAQGTDSIILSAQEIVTALDNVSGSTALIVDSCHSGGITRSVSSSGMDYSENKEIVTGGALLSSMAENKSGSLSEVLASSRLGEYSVETRDSDGVIHGAFTSALIRGLDTDNGTPASEDNLVTLGSLYNYAKENDGISSQLPQISGSLVDLVLFQL